MSICSHLLGDIVRAARNGQGLTQNQVAERIDSDVRTVLNIENYKGNPKLGTLYPLIRTLKIDAREIFYPEMNRDSPAIRQLRLLIEDCSEQEAATLVPIIESVLKVLRTNKAMEIE